MVAAETRGGRKPWEIDDGLWERIEPLPAVVERRYRYPGRRRLDDRRVLCGILFVPYCGIPWRYLPQELGFGSGMTCWRRLRDWNDAGVWRRLHGTPLAELRVAGMIDLSRAAADGSHVRALKGGPATGRSPVDRGRTGSKHHVIVEAHGIPLAATVTGGNRSDATQLIPLIQAIPPIRGKRGRPLCRPRRIHADRGYGRDVYRDQVRRFGITPVIARRGAEHGSRLGIYRWVVEGAFALPHWFRRLRNPLGGPGRHPPGIRHPRLRHHLLAALEEFTLIPARTSEPSAVLHHW